MKTGLFLELQSRCAKTTVYHPLALRKLRNAAVASLALAVTGCAGLAPPAVEAEAPPTQTTAEPAAVKPQRRPQADTPAQPAAVSGNALQAQARALAYAPTQEPRADSTVPDVAMLQMRMPSHGAQRQELTGAAASQSATPAASPPGAQQGPTPAETLQRLRLLSEAARNQTSASSASQESAAQPPAPAPRVSPEDILRRMQELSRQTSAEAWSADGRAGAFGAMPHTIARPVQTIPPGYLRKLAGAAGDKEKRTLRAEGLAP